MGMQNMVKLPSDRMTGNLDTDALERAIEEEIKKGNKPFFVNSIMGSTVMGGFDD